MPEGDATVIEKLLLIPRTSSCSLETFASIIFLVFSSSFSRRRSANSSLSCWSLSLASSSSRSLRFASSSSESASHARLLFLGSRGAGSASCSSPCRAYHRDTCHSFSMSLHLLQEAHEHFPTGRTSPPQEHTPTHPKYASCSWNSRGLCHNSSMLLLGCGTTWHIFF